MPNSSVRTSEALQVGSGTGVVFGDGLRCAGDTVMKLAPKLNAAHGSIYPAVGAAPISIKGAVPAKRRCARTRRGIGTRPGRARRGGT
jgi:hypothetical protein